MDIRQIHDSIQQGIKDTERIYTTLGDSFPKLLSVLTKSGNRSLPALQELLGRIGDEFSSLGDDETGFFEDYNRRNNALFDQLSDKMAALDSINERVSSIRADSEELEIISLNAMVISIKSGEKGRAFSTITENLKKLSARMISLSNELILDERNLIKKNEELKQSFSSLITIQKELSSVEHGVSSADIRTAVDTASELLRGKYELALGIMKPIQEAMTGIQMQDLIRQSSDQIRIALEDIVSLEAASSPEIRLDQLSMTVDLIQVCLRILTDINSHLDSSLAIFSESWRKVNTILDQVEKFRVSFIADFLDTANPKGCSLPCLLRQMDAGFTSYTTRISRYQQGQKSMVRDSTTIVREVKHLRTLFETIKPIIARLQHVRITQQIEVAKNSAIHAVKDTVDHMSTLIMQSDTRVQETRKELEAFIDSIESITTSFTDDAETDNRALERIKQDNTAFFNKMKGLQDELYSMVQNLEVYPASFQKMCNEVNLQLGTLASVKDLFSRSKTGLEDALETSTAEKKRLLSELGVSSWSIRNDTLRALVERFTITSHKEVAGQIGGFTVEKSGLDDIESGDVTLFF
jgi:ABC-type transporter Mla subunit MlaD